MVAAVVDQSSIFVFGLTIVHLNIHSLSYVYFFCLKIFFYIFSNLLMCVCVCVCVCVSNAPWGTIYAGETGQAPGPFASVSAHSAAGNRISQ